MRKQIALSQDTTLWSDYEGRGIPSRALTLPAGTLVDYQRVELGAGAHWLPFREFAHTVVVNHTDGRRYTSHRRTFMLREPFDASTYYSNAIERLPDGLWSLNTMGYFAADDGFGTLVRTQASSRAMSNHYSTCKRIEDCVAGPHYWI